MMSTMHQNVTIQHSMLNDVQGNFYNFNGASPGEHGIYELFKASSPDACYDSQARSPPPRCLRGTRVTFLEEIFTWITTADEKILWISGPAGAGKSAIAQTVAEACAKKLMLAASFFFFRGAPGRDSSDRLVASISYQIVTKLPGKRAQLGRSIELDLSILHKPLYTQFQELVIPLFITSSDSVHTSCPVTPFLVIIDGLDDCKEEINQRDIVRSIGKLINVSDIPLRFVIVSRPEQQIEESFSTLACTHYRIPLGTHSHFVSDHTSPYYAYNEVDQNIHAYLRHEFNRIYEVHNMAEEDFWPSDECLGMLVEKSGGIFIYATTLIKYVGDRDFNPLERLDDILNNSPGSNPFTELDHLYKCILGTHRNKELLLSVLSVVCCQVNYPGSRPGMTPDDIEELLHLWKGAIATALQYMHSVLDVQGLQIHHKSFVDFIHKKERAGEYFIDVHQAHALLAQMLLTHMSNAGACLCGVCSYARKNWEYHCQCSGRWYEHPQLLVEISKMIDSPTTDKTWFSNMIIQPTTFFSWFDPSYDDIIKTEHSDFNPLDVQCRLFKQAWKATPIFSIFYEDGLDVLEPLGPNLRPVPYAVLHSQPVKTLFTPFQNLVRQRLQENRPSDCFRISNGHAVTMHRCLGVYSREGRCFLSDNRENYHCIPHKYWSYEERGEFWSYEEYEKAYSYAQML